MMKGKRIMKTVKSTLARIAALVGMGTLVGVGCLAEAPEESKDVGSDEASTETETLTMEVTQGVAHAAKLSSSLLRVDLYDLQGALQFSVDFRLGGADEETIQWTSFGAPGTEPVSKSLKQPIDELPELKMAIAGAEFMQTKVSNAMANGEAYDSYGCDIPTWAVNSCGSKGKCCDVHDACYAQHGCTSSSWYWTTPGGACDKCNGNVVHCITFTNPGPSSCCAAGNCGQPR